MKEVIENIHDIVEVIPVAVMKLCLEIESRLANYIKPLSGSVLVQLIICGLYNIILKLQLGKFSNCFLFIFKLVIKISGHKSFELKLYQNIVNLLTSTFEFFPSKIDNYCKKIVSSTQIFFI